jgi:hypothetical protein
MRVLVAGNNAEIIKCSKLLRSRGCEIIEVEYGANLLDAIKNSPDLNGAIIDASICIRQKEQALKATNLVIYILETRPCIALKLFCETKRWKKWARDWVYNDAGDAVYLLLQDIYPKFSAEWWFSEKEVI